MLPIKDIEKFVKNEMKNGKSVTHEFDHLKRVANGAVWFVKILGDNKEEQDIAYVAGLLHDIVRPASETICHAKASAERSEQILNHFKIEKTTRDKIILAVKDHRLKVEWTSPSHQSVYLADKILEQMGAFIAFRRCMYVGECDDYQNSPMIETVQKHFKKRIDRIPKTEFPERFHKLVEYQWKWLMEMNDALVNSDKWVLNIVASMYNHGKAHDIGLEKAIRKFKSFSKEDEKYKKEALDYIDGKKWKDFEKLI